jgi:hypothetical protein
MMPILLVLLCLLAAMPVAAQSGSEPPAVGSRVRAWELPRSPLSDTTLRARVGRVRGIAADTLSLQLVGTFRTYPLPVDRLARLEISRGGSSRTSGALRGAGIGALATLAVAALIRGQKDGDLGVAILLGYVAPVAVGGGALLGALAASGERWEPMDWPNGHAAR